MSGSKKTVESAVKRRNPFEPELTGLPNYDVATESLAKVYGWAGRGFPGAAPEDLVRMMRNRKPELHARRIRNRAERNVGRLLREMFRKGR